LITILYRQHKKASSTHKLTSLYLIDAIARGARSKYKKQGKSKEPEEGSTTPKDGPVGEVGTYGSFLKKLEGILSKIVLDVWENAPAEHRVSLSSSRLIPLFSTFASNSALLSNTGKGSQSTRYLDESWNVQLVSSSSTRQQTSRCDEFLNFSFERQEFFHDDDNGNESSRSSYVSRWAFGQSR